MDLRHPHFAEPEWLWLAALAPLLVAGLFRYAAQARRKQMSAFAAAHLLEGLTASHSPFRRVLKSLLLVLVVAGMGLALARPQWGETTELSVALGEDIVFVVDCSRSMLVTDVFPSRLERAKFAILDFVQKHGRGRVGLVAFSGEAFLQCPLTFDYDAFREALTSLDDRAIPVPGTDIGRALNEGARAMEANDRHKVLVLITDGEDLEKTGVSESARQAKNGVVIHTVGVGTPNGGNIRIINDQGVPDFLRDKDGSIVQSHLDDKTLRAIAQAAHGVYQPLGQMGEGLNSIRLWVENAPKNSAFANSRKLGMDRFYVVVACVTFLLAVEPFLGTRRRGKISAHSSSSNSNATRPKAKPVMLLIGISTALWLAQSSIMAEEVTTSTSTSISKAPPTARDLYNQGTQKLKESKWVDAEAILQEAVATQDERIQPPALYNLGETRYLRGLADLKKKLESGVNESARAQQGIDRAETAIDKADWALAGTDMDAVVSAYRNGRGVRKELKAATEAVRKAMEQYGAILSTWQRASGDFKSAVEMEQKDADARSNAELVDRQIARLVDMQQQAAMTMQGAGQKMSELAKRLAELKKRIGPQPGGQKGPGEEDEDDENEKSKKPKGPEDGQDEQSQKSGREMQLTQEEAARLLGLLKLDANRKLFLGGTNDMTKPKDRKGRDW